MIGREASETHGWAPAPSGGAEGGGDQPPSFERGGLAEIGALVRQLSNMLRFFKDLGLVLDRCLDVLLRCKSEPLASDSNRVVSPEFLEASISPDAKPRGRWDVVALRALQLLAGQDEDTLDRQTVMTCPSLAKSVRVQLERFPLWNSPAPKIDFGSFFRAKGVDYSGEEVKLAMPLNWEAVKSSLPERVGMLELSKFCSLGTRWYVDHFEDFLLPEESRVAVKPPKVLVCEGSWPALCKGLIQRGICDLMPLQDVAMVGGRRLLNGLFAVGKKEYDASGLEAQRVIMNMIPLNMQCKSLKSDLITLPTLGTMTAYLLEEGEVALLSSEDIRSFYYCFSIPRAWRRFMGFNRLVPSEVKPASLQHVDCVLVARVLPMGFANSVGISQHVHRNVIKWASQLHHAGLSGEQEIRRDKGFPKGPNLYRIYLDNYDQLEKTDANLASVVAGRPSDETLAIRQAYETMGLPRHPKKSVVRALRAEVQWAWVMGDVGIAIPKPDKIWQYVMLAMELLSRGRSTLRELQVVIGGLVYVATFRRPLLCALNGVWPFMESLKRYPPVVALELPYQVQLELIRFLALVPLAQMNFRTSIQEHVSASDASTVGGGVCISRGLTPFGLRASQTTVRGEVAEAHDAIQILSVGLFDGISALRVACDLLQLPMAGHISIEIDKHGQRVVESYFPDAVLHNDVTTISEELVQSWALQFGNAGLVLIGAGLPCQGVSNLNCDRRGALRDHRSCLFAEIPRIVCLFKKYFPWAQVHELIESVASMSEEDRATMSSAFERQPWHIDAWGLTLCHRPRLYWITWELPQGHDPNVQVQSANQEVVFSCDIPVGEFLEEGWTLVGESLPTFTTSRPRSSPGRRPAGLFQTNTQEQERWRLDQHRFPPYQYRDKFCLQNKRGDMRIPLIGEREVLMGFPLGYTRACEPKSKQKGAEYNDLRLTLVGNPWHVGVAAWLINQLTAVLGLSKQLGAQQIVQLLTPGYSSPLQGLLLRPSLHRRKATLHPGGKALVSKLQGLVSIRGEDLMLQSSSETLVKFQRLRSTMPAQLWHWRDVASWAWRNNRDHINVLEMRAILTTVRWWVFKRHIRSQRFIHLTDSLVCLHALARGRTSSKRMRRTLIRIQSLLLAADLHPCWTYVHTSTNPADRPSRRCKYVRKKWVK